jgi:mono/diheme cytochrome c family protein
MLNRTTSQLFSVHISVAALMSGVLAACGSPTTRVVTVGLPGAVAGKSGPSVNGSTPLDFANSPGALQGPVSAATSAPLPTDDRAPVVASSAPPPISGGTLLIARDGVTAVVADPDRDRISVVDLRAGTIVGRIALDAGDQPGRLVEGASGRVYAVLRGAGAVATLDLSKAALVERRSVCGAPRGIAYDRAADALHVACVSGDLVTLPAGKGEVLRSVHVAPDLRDVVMQGNHVLVTQFKSATLLELDAAGEIVDRHQPGTVSQLRDTLDSNTGISSQAMHPFSAALARRAVALGDDRVLMLHEREMSDTVKLSDPHDPSSGMPNLGGSSYGGGDGCSSIVQTAMSVIGTDGTLRQSPSIGGSVVPVDIAVAPDGTIAIANAGTRDASAPLNFNGKLGPFPAGVGLPPGVASPPSAMGPNGASFSAGSPDAVGSVTMMLPGQTPFATEGAPEGCAGNLVSVNGQPIAVAFTADGALVVQSREPASLSIISSTGSREIALGGDSVLDTGHEIFHRDAGGGIACASCHGEGGDDGHVWEFGGLGPRRTQSVNIGLEGTAPFHWSGDMKDLPMLVSTVLVGRMGGTPQSEARVGALSGWLNAQQPPARIRDAADAAAVRGKALFESTEVGCTGCHNGDKFTNNQTVDVGTGGAFQVPSLVGIGYRAPFLHSGCAATLHDRFDPQCGGDKHGQTAQLASAQLDDLVAYLETL